MQRGMISFSPEEAHVVVQSMRGTMQENSRVVTALSKLHTQQKIEMSREEVESLLDQLPIPSSQEPEALRTARMALVQFLQPVKTQV